MNIFKYLYVFSVSNVRRKIRRCTVSYQVVVTQREKENIVDTIYVHNFDRT